MIDPFSELLQQQSVVILDGGFATELEHQGVDLSQDHLWDANALMNNQGAILAVHRAYFEAGADVSGTCSYQASFEGFARAGIGRSQAQELMRRSIRLAVQARDEFWAAHQAKTEPQKGTRRKRLQPKVAFSCGPYAAVLADGSEYIGYNDNVGEDRLAEFHRSKLQAIKGEPGVDVIAFETIPCLAEARAIVRVLAEERLGLPCWMSFSCGDGERVSHGEHFAAEVLPVCLQAEDVVAVGVNCTKPYYVTPLLRAAKAALDTSTKRPRPHLLCYPNSGEGWTQGDDGTFAWNGDAQLGQNEGEVGRLGKEWVAVGARLVGGCCRTTPAYIAELAAAFASKP